MNHDGTAKTIRNAAQTMRHFSDELNCAASNLQERNDWIYVSEAMQAVVNCFANLRLDLFVSRPIRELERAAVDQIMREAIDANPERNPASDKDYK